MSSLTERSKDGVINVLHTAFVGVKPGDQVVLKGYLRVLLRLDAMLEWVSASATQVDLFMINEEFREAQSVVKLLASKPTAAVLYVSRTEDKEGEVSQDKIVLPLKRLSQFSEWLLHSVAVLTHKPRSDTEQAMPETSTPDGEAIISTQINSQALNSQQTTSKQTISESTPAADADNTGIHSLPVVPENDDNAAEQHSVINHYQPLIDLIKLIQKRPAGCYRLISGDRTIAVIKPRRALIWFNQNNDPKVPQTLDFDWHLQPYNKMPEVELGSDLRQWLWQQAWEHYDLLLPLISDDATYRLRHWIKPVILVKDRFAGEHALSNKDRQHLISVMTALEKSACDVNTLASSAGISVKSAKRIVASLLFSSSLQFDSYIKLTVCMSAQMNASLVAASNTSKTTSKRATDGAVVDSYDFTSREQVVDYSSPVTTADFIAAKEEQATLPSNTTANTAPSTLESSAPSSSQPSTSAAQQEKRGFLSRLRQKLGL